VAFLLLLIVAEVAVAVVAGKLVGGVRPGTESAMLLQVSLQLVAVVVATAIMLRFGRAYCSRGGSWADWRSASPAPRCWRRGGCASSRVPRARRSLQRCHSPSFSSSRRSARS
jgi:hypothetical protein